MDIRDIKAFLSVAETLNFREAAEQLNMSQPPLTRLISNLEKDLGTKLFHRTTRKVELTGAGLHLLKESKGLLIQLEKMEKEVKSIGKLKAGVLNVGLQYGALHSDLPRLISSYNDEFSGVKTVLSAIETNNIKHDLKTGKMDIIISVDREVDDEIERIELTQQELGFLVSRTHPLANLKSAKLKDLKGSTLIFHGRHDRLGFQKDFAELLKTSRIPVEVYYKKAHESCGTLAVSGKGVLLSTKRLARLHGANVSFVPFADFKPKMKINAFWSKKSSSMSLKAFLNFLFEKAKVPATEMDYHLG